MNKIPSLSYLLSGFPPFAGLSQSMIAEIVSQGRIRRISRDQPVFEQGLEAEAFFLLTEGFVRVERTNPSGEQVVVRFFSAGQIIGVAPALNLSVYPASAIATVDCAVMAWPSPLWKVFARQFPDFQANVMASVGQRLMDTQERLIEISTTQAEQRIAMAIQHIGETVGRKSGEGFAIDFPLSRQDIAEMTATTQYTVSRLVSEWERAGIVDLGRQRLTVLSSAALARIANGSVKSQG